MKKLCIYHVETIEAAQIRQKHAWEHNALHLVIYECPFGEHFHLSRQLRDPAIEAFKNIQRQAMREQSSIAKGLTA